MLGCFLCLARSTPDEWISRHPDLVRLTGRHPFNVEPPLPKLMEEGFITSAALHYVRNHGAVPKIKWEEHNPSADVVVAVGSGYQPRVWHLFVGSLRRTGFTGDIVVGVNRDDLAQAEIVDFAKSQGVILYEISHLHLFLQAAISLKRDCL